MEPVLNPPVDLAEVQLVSSQKAAHAEIPLVVPNLGKPSPSMIVVNLPECVTTKHARALVRDLRDQLGADCPLVQLDMSDVREIDLDGIDLLLECLYNTVRRDGVVQLRGVSPEAATMLELTGMNLILNSTVCGECELQPGDLTVDVGTWAKPVSPKLIAA